MNINLVLVYLFVVYTTLLSIAIGRLKLSVRVFTVEYAVYALLLLSEKHLFLVLRTHHSLLRGRPLEQLG